MTDHELAHLSPIAHPGVGIGSDVGLCAHRKEHELAHLSISANSWKRGVNSLGGSRRTLLLSHGEVE